MRTQSGHLSTYLMPWIAGAAIAGAFAGSMLGRDPALWSLAAGAVALAGYAVLSAAVGMLAARRDAAAARAAVRRWADGNASDVLVLDAACRHFDGYQTGGAPWERQWGGCDTRHVAFALDAAGGRIALARDATVEELSLRGALSWRRAGDPPGDEHDERGRLFVIELQPSPEWVQPGVTPVHRVEIAASSAGADTLADALRRNLGDPSDVRQRWQAGQ